ncbi:hypothetical protein [Intrasporangium sp.]|uniref:hypothetical protein n=1 Tax=Intrasporangium sp. TaxID=1925024 RepID=UPI003221FB35
MRIHFLTTRWPTRDSVTRAAAVLLADWGVQVRFVRPEPGGGLEYERADLYILKSADDAVLRVADALESAGAGCLNRPRVVRLTRDHAGLAGALRSFGVSLAAPTEAASGSDAGRDDDAGTKVYRIGGQVFGVERRGAVVRPLTVPVETRELTDVVARVLGSDLFGLDLAAGGADPLRPDGDAGCAGPVVAQVHAFPGFKGVPDGGLRLADYIYAAAHEQAAEREVVRS